jgi:hypothetical protein
MKKCPCFLIPFLIFGLASSLAAATWQQTLTAAGNAADAQRLELLRQLRQQRDLPPALIPDVDKAILLVDRWVNGAEVIPYSETRPGQKAYLLFFLRNEEEYAPLVDGSPLRPLFAYYRARMLLALKMENGWGNRPRAEERAKLILGWLREAEAAYPKNQNVKMLLGHRQPWPMHLAGTGGAPEWAVLQRELIERLTAVIHWWIDHRQLDDGQFGGMWGDDCEMWRWWTPVLIGFADPKVNEGQAKFSRGLLNAPHMRGGYLDRVRDVQHSAEDTADTITPMMHLEPANPEWAARSLRLLELMRTVWAGPNQAGGFQFMSTHLGSAKILEGPAYGFDTGLHGRVVQPALLLWQRTGHAPRMETLAEWVRMWVDVSVGTGRGKPAGVVPSVVQWPQGLPGIDGKWWDIDQRNPEKSSFPWPAHTRLMFNVLLTAWYATGDTAYLRPMEMSAELRLRHLDGKLASGPEGSEGWAAASDRYAEGLLGAIRKYRLLTGDTRYDRLLQRDKSGSADADGEFDERRTLEHLRAQADTWRSDFDALTSEVRFTDRVLEMPRRWFLAAGLDPNRAAANTGLLYRMISGDSGPAGYFPLNAVRWLTPARDMAAWVRQADLRSFRASLHHFAPGPREFEAELYLLEPGNYRVRLEGRNGRVIQTLPLKVEGRGARVRLQLPPRETCELRIERAEPGRS